MSNNSIAFFVVITLSLMTSLGIYSLVCTSLRSLLTDVIKMPAGTIFFSRSLLISLLCVTLSDTIGQVIYLSADAAFMEYVWKVAAGLSPALHHTWLFLLGYLVLITIIVALRGARNE